METCTEKKIVPCTHGDVLETLKQQYFDCVTWYNYIYFQNDTAYFILLMSELKKLGFLFKNLYSLRVILLAFKTGGFEKKKKLLAQVSSSAVFLEWLHRMNQFE